MPNALTKSRSLFAGLVLASAFVLPFHARQAGTASQSAAITNPGSFNGSTVAIPMRDGRSLAADLFVPKSGGKHPVILIQTPYNRGLVRPWVAGEGRWGADSLFTDSNYAFVITDWRGKFDSSGALTPGMQANLSQDGYDTCAWIAKQDWCNGKIATWGPSALGRVQYETWKVFERNFVRPEEFEVPMLFIGGWYDIYTDGVLDAFAAVRTRGGSKARAHSKLVMGPWLHNTDQFINGGLEYPKGRLVGMSKARGFLDYWVRGVANGFDSKEPSISYYQMGVDQWRATNTWPPEGTKERRYYLQKDFSLSPSAPNKSRAAVSFRYDPARPVPTFGGHVLDPALKGGPQDQREKIEGRDDVLVFTTPVLTSDLSVTGKIRVELSVSSDRVDTDFTAIVTDVHPDGRSMLVTEGIRRMRFRNGVSREEMMNPGQPYAITIDLTNTAITFLKGHRVRLIISSSNHPKYALNLNDGGPMYKKGNALVAINTIYVDAWHPSALILPIGAR